MVQLEPKTPQTACVCVDEELLQGSHIAISGDTLAAPAFWISCFLDILVSVGPGHQRLHSGCPATATYAGIRPSGTVCKDAATRCCLAWVNFIKHLPGAGGQGVEFRFSQRRSDNRQNLLGLCTVEPA